MREDELFEKYGGFAGRLREKLSPVRYRHSLGVAFTSAALAMRYGTDVEKAFLAGLLHDAAKYMSGDEYLEKAAEFDVCPTESERLSPGLLHARLGAVIAEREYGVTDPEILAAIASHTTGRAGMSLLEEIVCVADYIEPLRPTLPLIDEIRTLAFTDIDRAILVYAGRQVAFLKESGRPIDPRTEETFRYYEEKTGRQNSRATGEEKHDE